jgi:hypothetical protein
MRALLLLALVGSASADELVMHIGSAHADHTYRTGEIKVVGTDWSQYTQTGMILQIREYETRPLNNTNLGLGYGWSNGWAVGGYRNSYYRPSVYVARTWLTSCYISGLECGASLGAASGYQQVTKSGIMPIAGLTARFHVGDRWAVNLTGIPTLSPNMSGVVHLYLSRHLD